MVRAPLSIPFLLVPGHGPGPGPLVPMLAALILAGLAGAVAGGCAQGIPGGHDPRCAAVVCDDGNPCTADRCEAGICTYPPWPEGTSCSDGNPCNGEEQCDDAGQCFPRPPVRSCCLNDQDCPSFPCISGRCQTVPGQLEGHCELLPIAGCCRNDGDCPTVDPCAPGRCLPTSHTCVFARLEDCCRTDGECPPGDDPCDAPHCDPQSRRCGLQPMEGCCRTDGECPPGDDPCLAPHCDPQSRRCGLPPVEGCCRTDGECPPGDDPCLAPHCDPLSRRCGLQPVEGCCRTDEECPPSGILCYTTVCNPESRRCELLAETGCCQEDGDCPPGDDPCLTPRCDPESHRCTYTVQHDVDGDGFRPCDGDCDDAQAQLDPADRDGDGFSTCQGDCDDGDAALQPRDLDQDGFSTCSGDCDDRQPAAHPGAPAVCGDGIDNDCDGSTDEEDAGEEGECPPPVHVLINEILYDDASIDGEEVFVELWSSEPGRTLAGHRLVLFDVVGRERKRVALDLLAIPASGFVTIVHPSAGPELLALAQLVDRFADLYNEGGSLVLLRTGLVVDALAWGGVGEAGRGEGRPVAGVTVPGHSLSRDAAHTDRGDNLDDFMEQAVPTPGGDPPPPDGL